jgi:hypothetical protein
MNQSSAVQHFYNDLPNQTMNEQVIVYPILDSLATTQWRSMRAIKGDQRGQSITTQWHSILSRTVAFWLNHDIPTKVPIISYLVLSCTDFLQ